MRLEEQFHKERGTKMRALHEIKDIEERVILLAVEEDERNDTNACLDELEELASTAGAVVVGRMIQKREKIHPGTYIVPHSFYLQH